jgi:hypothetical protein
MVSISFAACQTTGSAPLTPSGQPGATEASMNGKLTARSRSSRRASGLEQIILVGDRGMLTRARLEQDLQTAGGIDWITCLRAPAIRRVVDGGVVQLSFFDERDLCEVTSPDYPDYPGERLVVCRTPLLAAERRRRREDLLVATEKELAKTRTATVRPATWAGCDWRPRRPGPGAV